MVDGNDGDFIYFSLIARFLRVEVVCGLGRCRCFGESNF